VILAHRDNLIRDMLSNLLGQASFRVSGQADTMKSLRQQLGKNSADIILLDWGLNDQEEDDIIKDLVQSSPRPAVVILGRPQTPETFLSAIQAGVRGFLSYSLSAEDFVGRLRLLASGDLVISGDLAEGLMDQWTTDQPEEAQDDLSNREREVLNLIATGDTNREIAGKLTVTENTVKVHLRRILEKLDLRNRQQAVAYAVRTGLADEDSDPNSESNPC